MSHWARGEVFLRAEPAVAESTIVGLINLLATGPLAPAPAASVWFAGIVHHECMSDVAHDLPTGADAPSRMLRSNRSGRAARAIAIVVLLLAAATVLLSLSPAWASADAFTGDLAAGRVDYV